MGIFSFLQSEESKLKAPLQTVIAQVLAEAKASAAGNPMLSFLVSELEAASTDPNLPAEIEAAVYNLLLSKRSKAPASPASPTTPPTTASPTPATPAAATPAPVPQVPAPAAPAPALPLAPAVPVAPVVAQVIQP